MAFASKSLRCRDLPLTALTSFALLFGILRLQAFNFCNMLIFGAITVPSSLMQGTLANYGASRLRCYHLTGIQLTSRVIQHQTCCLREDVPRGSWDSMPLLFEEAWTTCQRALSLRRASF